GPRAFDARHVLALLFSHLTEQEIQVPQLRKSSGRTERLKTARVLLWRFGLERRIDQVDDGPGCAYHKIVADLLHLPGHSSKVAANVCHQPLSLLVRDRIRCDEFLGQPDRAQPY